jgi:regulator of replication initiation timing
MSLPSKADGEDLGRLVAELVEEVTALRTEVAALKAENAALREEIARLKGLSGRPKLKPSGMERATAPKGERPQGRTKGAARATGLVVHEEHVLAVAAPPGSRFKG